jgi:TolA-binding protein
MNHHDDTLIQDYATGQLSGSQKAAFERRLQTEPELKAELDLYVAMMALEQQRLKQSLFQSLEDQDAQPLKPGASRKWIWGLAGLALMVTLAVWYGLQPAQNTQQQPTNTKEIALEYIRKAYPSPVVSMGNDTLKTALKNAFLAYRKGQFQDAAKQLKPLADQPDANDEVLFYTGESYLQTADYPTAIQYFSKVKTDYWRESADWRMTLAMLLNDQEKEARVLLEKHQQGEHKNEAEKLLKAIQ